MLHLHGDKYMMQGESSSFKNRQKSIFDQLDAVTSNFDVAKQNVNLVDEHNPSKFKKSNSGERCAVENVSEADIDKTAETKHFKGKESIFKRPEPPPPNFKRQTIPDFQRNPHKWTKYSLCDVSQDDMSDKSNTAAAMAFLNEIRSKKTTDDTDMEVDNKITFKRPFRPKQTSGPSVVKISNDDTPGEDGTKYFRGSKLIMPEYIVGEKKKSLKISKEENKGEPSINVKDNKMKEIKLNHLIEDDDDDDDDEEIGDNTV